MNTPIFSGIIDPNAFNTVRRRLIKKIQNQLGSKLICYVANPSHQINSIMHHDIILFEDLLRSTGNTHKIYFMINSPGGDPNTAEKMIVMCRERFPDEFNVIIPNFAKSAATMIALGADKIFMGYLAELGPIDPQLSGPIPGQGSIPARSFIDGLNEIRRRINEDGDPVQMYLPMLNQIKPEVLAICQRAIDDSQAFAEKWLSQGMLKNDLKQAKDVATWLSKGEKYKSHGKVIDFQEAHDVLKLNVEKMDRTSKLWSDIWELYCRQMQGPPPQQQSMRPLIPIPKKQTQREDTLLEETKGKSNEEQQES